MQLSMQYEKSLDECLLHLTHHIFCITTLLGGVAPVTNSRLRLVSLETAENTILLVYCFNPLVTLVCCTIKKLELFGVPHYN